PGGAEERFGKTVRQGRRPSSSLLRRDWWRCQATPQGSATPRLGRNHRQTTQFRLRTRPQKRRMGQTEMHQRTGIRHRRVHSTARGTQTFRRSSRRLLQDRDFVFAGKAGTGFTTKSLAALHKKFRAEERADCPFVDLPSKQNGQWVLGITPSMMKKIHWINPKFVAEIKFAEWTRDGKLRAPVFMGLREDKKPGEVVREV